MHRSSALGSVLMAGVCLVMLLAGCVQSGPVKPSGPPPQTSVAPLSFGPVYPVAHLTDPVVARTIKGDAIDDIYHARRQGKSNAPVVSAEIRGYLVDWVGPTSRRNGTAILEYAVMKDGTVYQMGGRPSTEFGGGAPPARLMPESANEARLRMAALAAAQREVDKLNPQFAKVSPVVYNYLVRIHRTGGATTDVWVDPNVGFDRFFYGSGLGKQVGK
jgi:hypothetical protein